MHGILITSSQYCACRYDIIKYVLVTLCFVYIVRKTS